MGELGWCPLSVEIRRFQFSVFSRLGAAGGQIGCFNYTVHSPGSWAQDVKMQLQFSGASAAPGVMASCLPGMLVAKSCVSHLPKSL